MYDLTHIDPCGLSISAMDAFFRGLKLDLKVVKFEEEFIVASPAHPVFHFMTFHCFVPTWMFAHMRSDMVFTVSNFITHGENDVVSVKSKERDLLPIIHPGSQATSIGEVFAGLGGWTLGAKMMGGAVSLMVEVIPKLHIGALKITTRVCSVSMRPLIESSTIHFPVHLSCWPTFVIQECTW